MSRDILADATRALRAQPVAPRELAARRTRERVMTSLRSERPRRRRGLYLVPLAAILIGSTAWASGMLPDAWQALSGEPEPDRRERAAEIEVVQALPEQRPAPRFDLPPPIEVESEPEPELEPEAEAAPATQPAPAPSTPAEPVDPAAALYRSAHEAHFALNDASLALTRWNAYLAAAPSGRFVPEALYNRALCLVRLGQHGAAIAALKPFAAGSYGAYRQAEATRLVDALEAQ